MEYDRSLADLLRYAVSQKSSAAHFGEGIPPAIRIDNNLIHLESAPFTREKTIKFILEFLSEDKFRDFEREKECDYSFGVPSVGRFRGNLFVQRGAISCAIRVLPFKPMTLDQIGFPTDIARLLTERRSGLILVTGPTGNGKTTTLAAMINHMNETQTRHIVTVEDPIEFIYENKKSIINQREVGADTHSFGRALKHVLRQDPDVILIGEMRDLESIEIALLAADTGHLVLATLHTPDATQSVNRIINVFSVHQQQQVRTQLSFVLQAVISQKLIPREGGGRVLAAEVLLVNPAVRNVIREGKAHQLYSSLQIGQKEGMRTFNMSLDELARAGKITEAEAMSRSTDPQELERLLRVQKTEAPKKKALFR